MPPTTGGAAGTGTSSRINLILNILTQNQQALNQVVQGINQISSAGQNLNSLNATFGTLTTAVTGFLGALAGLNVIQAVSGGVRDLAASGISYNATLEQNHIGLQALIASLSTLKDANGQVLEGEEKFIAAGAVAEEMLAKIQLRALTTANTIKELVDAFQSGLGQGLAAGLDRNQILDLTVSIANAAKAMGLNTSQINQEMRALLSATISEDAALAKALGITNEMVKQWIAQGILYDKLSKKLEQFKIAGKDVGKSWEGITSNLEDVQQQLAGTLTSGLFDKLKDGFNAAFDAIKSDTGGLSSDLNGLVETGRGLFTMLGESIRQAMGLGIEALTDLSSKLEGTRWEVLGTGQAFINMGEQILGLTAQILSANTKLKDVIAGATFTEEIMNGLGVLVAGMRDFLDFMTAVYKKINAFFIDLGARGLGMVAKVASVFDKDLAGAINNAKRAMQGFGVSVDDAATKAILKISEGQSHTAEYIREYVSQQQMLDKLRTGEAYTEMAHRIGLLEDAVKSGTLSFKEQQTELKNISSEMKAWANQGMPTEQLTNLQEQLDSATKSMQIHVEQQRAVAAADKDLFSSKQNLIQAQIELASAQGRAAGSAGSLAQKIIEINTVTDLRVQLLNMEIEALRQKLAAEEAAGAATDASRATIANNIQALQLQIQATQAAAAATISAASAQTDFGTSAQRSGHDLEDSFESAGDTIDGVVDRINNAMRQLIASAQSGQASVADVRAEFAALNAEAGEIGMSLDSSLLWQLEAYATRVAILPGVWDKVTDSARQSLRAQLDGIELWTASGMRSYDLLLNKTREAITTEEQFVEQAQAALHAYDGLGDKTGAEASTARAHLLALARQGEAMGDTMTRAAEDVQEALRQVQDEARAAAEELTDLVEQMQDERDQLRGDEQSIETRRYAEQLEEIQALERQGGDAARARAIEARALAREIHEEKMRQIREEQSAESSAQRTEATGPTETPTARGSRRASAGAGGPAGAVPSVGGGQIVANYTIHTDATSLLNRAWIRNHLIPAVQSETRLRG